MARPTKIEQAKKAAELAKSQAGKSTPPQSPPPKAQALPPVNKNLEDITKAPLSGVASQPIAPQHSAALPKSNTDNEVLEKLRIQEDQEFKEIPKISAAAAKAVVHNTNPNLVTYHDNQLKKSFTTTRDKFNLLKKFNESRYKLIS